MNNGSEKWAGDLKIAASFIRSIETGRPDLDFELKDLASAIEQLAAFGPDKPPGPKSPEDELEAA